MRSIEAESDSLSPTPFLRVILSSQAHLKWGIFHCSSFRNAASCSGVVRYGRRSAGFFNTWPLLLRRTPSGRSLLALFPGFIDQLLSQSHLISYRVEIITLDRIGGGQLFRRQEARGFL